MTPEQRAERLFVALLELDGVAMPGKSIAQIKLMAAAIREAVAAEREACAVALDALADGYDPSDHTAAGIYEAATVIRERGKD